MTATAPAHNPPAPLLTHRQTMTVLAALMTGLFLAAIDTTIVATALPSIVGDLGGVDQLSWVIVAYLLSSTAATPLWGKLSDLFGRKLMFQATIIVFIVGSVVCGAAQTMNQLIAFRALQGVGGGGLFAVIFAILGDIVPPRQRGRYLGYFTAVFAGAGIIGPLAGGFFVDHVSWRWIFYINLPLGVIALLVTAFTLKIEQRRRAARVDFFGAVLLVGAVVAVTLVTTWGGNDYAWGSAQILSLGASGLVLTVAFVLWERRASEPILPLRLFANPVVRVTLTLSFLGGSALYAGTVFLPVYLQGVTGVSATNSGLLISPMMLGVSVGSVVTGRVTTVTGRYKIWVVVGFALLSANLAFLSTIGADTSQLTISLAMVVQGLALGAAMPVFTTATQNAVDMADLGSATSAVQFVRSLGGSFGIAMFGGAFAARLADRLAGVAAGAELPPGVNADSLANSPTIIAGLPVALREQVTSALADSIALVFLIALPMALLALLVSFLLRELPLRDHAAMFAASAGPGGPALEPLAVQIPPAMQPIRIRPPYLDLLRQVAGLEVALRAALRATPEKSSALERAAAEATRRLDPLVARLGEVDHPSSLSAPGLAGATTAELVQTYLHRLADISQELAGHRPDPVTAALLHRHRQRAGIELASHVGQPAPGVADHGDAPAAGHAIATWVALELARRQAIRAWADSTPDQVVSDLLVRAVDELQAADIVLLARLGEDRAVAGQPSAADRPDWARYGSAIAEGDKLASGLADGLLTAGPEPEAGALDPVTFEILRAAQERTASALDQLRDFLGQADAYRPAHGTASGALAIESATADRQIRSYDAPPIH